MEGKLEDRLENIRNNFERNGIDGLIVMRPENRRYASGFTGTAGMLFITLDSAWLFTDFRYDEQAKSEAACYCVEKYNNKPTEALVPVVGKTGCKMIGFEKDFITYQDHEKLSGALDRVDFIPTENIIENLRAKKDRDEIEAQSKAALIADKAFNAICNYVKEGMKEKEIALEIDYRMRKFGSEGNSFPTIVASGPRASLPHAGPSCKEVQRGEFLKMDFGATYNGYCSDLTRTVALGEYDGKQKEIYEVVLMAQKKALAGIQAGKKGIDVDRIARDFIASAGYGDNFGHGLGHGVGLFIHEAPSLSPKGSSVLEAGNVVTIEPGIYIPGWGGVRIEDLVKVTENGHENLTSSPKELLTI